MSRLGIVQYHNGIPVNQSVNGTTKAKEILLSNGSNVEDALMTLLDQSVPVGSVIHSCAVDVPEGYLVCNGSEVSREDYADLFNVIGTTFGEGDGSTTFVLPNLINTSTTLPCIKY